jgi:hypothetical protein
MPRSELSPGENAVPQKHSKQKLLSLPKLDILDPKPKYSDDTIPQGLGKYRRLYFTVNCNRS